MCTYGREQQYFLNAKGKYETNHDRGHEEVRARESREEGETRRPSNAEAMSRESREEDETWRRANADATREARASEADSWRWLAAASLLLSETP